MQRHELLRLSVANLRQYLAGVLYRLPFRLTKLKRIEEVGEYSNNNYLFRLTVGEGREAKRYYLKQAQPYNRRSVLQGKPQAVHPSRAVGEVKLIKRLRRLWGQPTVPKVYFLDRRHYAFLMSDVAQKGKILIEEFSRRRVHPELGEPLGRYFGKLHCTTYKTSDSSGSGREWREQIVSFFDEHWGFGIRQHFPHHQVGSFYYEVCSAPTSIIWGDPVYRNIFVKPGRKISFIDFDHTVRYDPMFDVGMLLAHWVWMWLKRNRQVARDCERFISACSQAYWASWQGQPRLLFEEREAMQHRLGRWIGLYLVSRTDGLSGSYFEEWPAWEQRVRQLGVALFAERATPQTRRLAALLSL